MIYGIGHDVLEIQRIEALMNKGSGAKFIRRILTEAELELLERRGGNAAEFIAGRFAAKEAVVKALGCGIGREVGFQDIQILPDAYGKPIVTLGGGLGTAPAERPGVPHSSHHYPQPRAGFDLCGNGTEGLSGKESWSLQHGT